MKKLLLSVAVGSALGLTGCLSDGDTAPVTEEQSGVPFVRVVFDPAAGDISVPSNFLYLGTEDGTLDVPNDGPQDPAAALAAQDGWSTTFPIVFNFSYPRGEYGSRSVTIDGTSAEASGAVHVFKIFEGGNSVSPECAELQPVVACAVQEELEFGTDFVVSFNNVSGALSVVPLRPLEAGASYMVALTDLIEDDRGRSVRPSQTYYVASQSDIELEEDGALIQGIVRQNHRVLDSAGVNPESVIYASVFTTQSTTDVLHVVQGLLASDLAALGAGEPATYIQPINVNYAGASIAQALAAAEALPPSLPAPGEPFFAEYAVSSTADLYAGTVGVPYFSGIEGSDPLTVSWQAEYVSPVTIALALQNERISAAELVGCGMTPQVVADFGSSRDPSVFFAELAYDDLPSSGCEVLNDERNLTKYNPLPQMREPEAIEIPVLMSVPEVNRVNAVRAQLSAVLDTDLPPLTEPANGWPIVIFQHGITGNKEQFMAIAGALSVSGHAAVAIDHPLHGERGFGAINASARYIDENGDPAAGDPTVYLNLGSLLTARDNLRQSSSDILALRFALAYPLSNFGGANINSANVKFIGHSLGGITGINATAIGNTPFPNMPEGFPLDEYFAFSQVVYGMAGGGIAPFLLESESFGPLIREQLAAQAGGLEGAQLEALIQQFAFAAQTAIDSGDPLNYGHLIAATQTPALLIQADGDDVIPNQASLPLAGTAPLSRALGLAPVSGLTVGEDGPVSGYVRFSNASHGSLLQQGEDDAEGITLAIQLMIATWLESNGVILNAPE